MRKFLVTYLPASLLLVFLAMILWACGGGGGGGGTANAATPTSIDWNVSGTIVGVQVASPSPTGYSGPALLIDAFLKGAPENAQFRVLAAAAEGPPDVIPECLGDGINPDGQYFAFDDMVIIFEDLSMIFAKMNPDLKGWSCFTGEPAVANMEIIGGTGRYEDAQGHFQGIFGGMTFEDSQALIAEFGTIVGEIM